MKTFFWLLSFIFLVVVSATLAGSVLVHKLKSAGPLQADSLVLIEKGQGVRSMAQYLVTKGVVEKDLYFMAAVFLRQAQTQLKAGEYEFKAGASAFQVVDIIASGKVYQHSLTVPEGLSVREVADIISKAPSLSGTIEALPPEGALMPDTYNYTYGMSRMQLLNRMQQAMTTALNEAWLNRAPDLPLASAQEALILASIVERETGVPEERARVAGVFINRLKTGMKLQTDPTLIYAATFDGKLGLTRMDGPIKQSDIANPSPYNTYVHAGLPPAPIANPGRASLQATLHPEQHGFLFFVATGKGGHTFTTTYSDHSKAVSDYRAIVQTQPQTAPSDPAVKAPSAPQHNAAPALPAPTPAAPPETLKVE